MIPLSSCCKAPVSKHDWADTFYICEKCNMACELDHPPASTGHGVEHVKDVSNESKIVHEAQVGAEGKTDTGSISDGYHTFDELYDHRITLYIALCRSLCFFREKPYVHPADPRPVWRSQLHSDGSKFDGWFILGIGKEKGKQVTYHLPNIKWDEVSFAETLDVAPEFDGHTSADVLERIKNL